MTHMGEKNETPIPISMQKSEHRSSSNISTLPEIVSILIYSSVTLDILHQSFVQNKNKD